MTQYKFWVVYHEGCFYGRFDDYQLAKTNASKVTGEDPERRPAYVLEAVWYTQAKTAWDMDSITDQAPRVERG